jgi:four helix bundle protein
MALAGTRKAGAGRLADQLLRSSTSVGANCREAQRSRSAAELASKLAECLREADEAHYWIELIIALELMPETRLRDLQHEASELIAILTTLTKNAKHRG